MSACLSLVVTKKVRLGLLARPRLGQATFPDRAAAAGRMINSPLTLPFKLDRRANGFFQSFR
jgi:hypothetical protein